MDSLSQVVIVFTMPTVFTPEAMVAFLSMIPEDSRSYVSSLQNSNPGCHIFDILAAVALESHYPRRDFAEYSAHGLLKKYKDKGGFFRPHQDPGLLEKNQELVDEITMLKKTVDELKKDTGELREELEDLSSQEEA